MQQRCELEVTCTVYNNMVYLVVQSGAELDWHGLGQAR